MKLTPDQINRGSFSQTILNSRTNGVDHEECSHITDYANSDIKHCDLSENKIKLYENVLLTKYIKQIRDTCYVNNYTKEEQIYYSKRPERLSYDEYGMPDLWYLILICNYCECVDDFVDMGIVKLPNIHVIENILSNIEYIENKGEQ